MRTLCVIALLLLGSMLVVAQDPPSLDTFTSSDGTFQFVYPENYELLVGERILRGTQGRHAGIPVCDFSTAIACVIYPVEGLDNSKLEAAGFSVSTVQGPIAEPACIQYKDRGLETPPAVLSGSAFRFASTRTTSNGHSQSVYLYRTFRNQHCYELRIAVSLAGDFSSAKPANSNSLGDARADSARESLKLILATFAFR